MARLLAIIAIGIWIIFLSPNFTAAFIAAVTAALMLPVYRWLRARMGKLKAVICFTTGLVFCVGAPITIAVSMVAPQAMEGARRFGAWLQEEHHFPVLLRYLNEAHEFFIKNDLEKYVPNFFDNIEKFQDEIATGVGTIAKTILDKIFPSIALSLAGDTMGKVWILLSKGLNLAGDTVGTAWTLVLFLVFTILFVVYAPAIKRVILLVLPRHEEMVDRFSLTLHNASRAVFIGLVFVPIIQGTLTGIGFHFLNVPDPAFWGLLAIFAAVVPMAGTAMIWIPTAIYLGVTRSLSDALMMLGWGCIVVSGSDNLLRPYFLKTGIQAPMFVLLFSSICSLAVFGAVGLIAGPVLVALAVQAVEESKILYKKQSGVL